MHKRHLGLSAAGLVLASGTSLTVLAQDEEPVEEIVVTGSYIRGTPTDAPSPVQVIGRNSIQAQGAAVLWDVIKNLEVNSGSVTNPGSGDNSQVDGLANVNLRNLGENSTLTLVNGKRQVPAAANTRSGGELVDLNTIPLVMTERIEILTDGGSALYGADAVAGVVNVIMRTDFVGFELYGDVQGQWDDSDLQDRTGSAIWGWESDSGNTNFVLAAERFERDGIPVTAGNFYDERSEFLGGVASVGGVVNIPPIGSNMNPAYFNPAVTAVNVAEGGSGDMIFSDPLCTQLDQIDGVIGRRHSDRGEQTGTCYEPNAEWNYLSQQSERNSFAASFNHRFGNNVEFYSFFQHSENETLRADDGYNEARGPSVFLAQPGASSLVTIPGFYAVAQPMELGYFAPAAGLTRPTAADIPNAPVDAAHGGINVPFWSNVRYGVPRQGDDSNITESSTTGGQIGLKGDFLAGERSFSWDVSYSYSESSLEQTYSTLNRQRAELAANGLGGPSCEPNGVTDFDFSSALGPFGAPTAWNIANGAFYTGYTQTFFPGFVFTTREALSLALTSNNHGQDGCMFYNPFLTQFTNPAVANSPELMEWMNETVNVRDKRNDLGVFDAVLSGDLIQMPGGMSQFAIGGQYRDRNAKSRASKLNLPGIPNAILGYDDAGVPNEFHYVSNNFDCSLCAFNYDHNRTVKAVFGELSMPVWENVETQIALRYEDYGGEIGSEVSPKFAVSWRPVNSLLLRASYSESFRAPNISVVEEGLESSGVTFRDPIANQAVRAGLLPPTNQNAEAEFTYTLGVPAPDVGNESAKTYSTGFIWTPTNALDGLHVQADYWRFDVRDRVLPQPPISALAPEIAAFEAAVGDPSNYVLNSTVSSNVANPYTACDPNQLEADFGRDSAERLDCVVDPRLYTVIGIQRAVNSGTANLITLTLGAINAGIIESDGVDVTLGYTWDTSWGLFNVGVDYTHVRKYELKDVPGLELGLLDIGVFDAAGTTGDNNLVRSLPDNKGHVTFNWMRGNHGVTVIGRYIGSYRDLAYQTEFENANDYVRPFLSPTVDSYNSWDLQYRYTHDWDYERLGSWTFTVGILDAFDADLPYRETSTLNYDASVFDGRGRRFYGRVLMQF